MLIWTEVEKVQGWLTADEGYSLYELAAHLKKGATIVELGSYCGKSTVCLAKGARQSGARVITIDHHKGSPEIKTGPLDTQQELMRTLETSRVMDIVTVVVGKSSELPPFCEEQDFRVDLVFIDGDHSLDGVRQDVEAWLPIVTAEGLVAFHDYRTESGVARTVDELISSGTMVISGIVDNLIILQKPT